MQSVRREKAEVFGWLPGRDHSAPYRRQSMGVRRWTRMATKAVIAVVLVMLLAPCSDAAKVEGEKPPKPVKVDSVAALKKAGEAKLVVVVEIHGKDLAEIASLTSVEELELASCLAVSEECFNALALCKRLRKLTFFGCESGEWRHLAMLAPLSDLVYLKITTCQGLCSRAIRAIGKLTRLTELWLGNLQRVESCSYSALKKCIRLEVFHTWDLRDPKASDFAFLSSLKELRRLDLWGGGFGPGLAETVSTLPKLKSMDVAFKGCTDDDVMPLLGIESLTELSIRTGDGVTDEFYRRLILKTNVATLNMLPAESVTGSFIEALDGARSLQYLGISGWDLTIKRSGHWLQLKECPSLEEINIRIAPVGDPGTIFRALARMEGLRKIVVYGSHAVTKSHLRDLMKVKKLEILGVTYLTGISNEQLQTLERDFKKKFGEQLKGIRLFHTS